ncbi:c-type cytochrome [Dyella sp.]|uniref:c-type cytochrome n=1 Tax=Dyella sp. TaxID=1869338 RepID=UPI002D7889B0|nr:c-type cytochrome [Dyella sp.]HET7330638.1 c-type cytochrome [Dyella sp.]
MRFRQALALVAVLIVSGMASAQMVANPPASKTPSRTTSSKTLAPKTPREVNPPSGAPVKTPMNATAASPAAPSSSASTQSSAKSGPAAELAKLEAVPTKPGDATVGQTKAGACAACHGMDGNSSDAQYPKLAGQNESYIVRQLMNFKSGSRTNAIMQGMAAPLTPQDMHDIGAYFASQKVVPGVTDDALAGPGGKLFREGNPERQIPACMSCHGPDGHGNPGAVYPQLAGQHADYVQKQLQGWHDGDNSWGNDPHAQIMPAIAQRLTKDDIVAVASYVEGLHTAKPGEQVSGPEAAPAKAPAGGSSAPAKAGSAAQPASSSSKD